MPWRPDAMPDLPYLLLADAVLLIHFAVVLFVVGGLGAIVVGNVAGWPWVNGRGFRWSHLGAIGFIVVQAWLGRLCPLTMLESWLRELGGGPAYRKSFIAHWVERLLYYEAPMSVFALVYSGFALLVLLAWWRWPPRQRVT